MAKTVCGVGVNDSDYVTQKYMYFGRVGGKVKHKLIWRCPYYNVWKSMITRCYSRNKDKLYPTYAKVSVCEEWLVFSNFKSWMEKQDWEGKELDKDLLVPGNKIYSPETCCFLDRKVNNFIRDIKRSRGNFPTGVYFNKKLQKYVSQCIQLDGKQKYLGLFNTAKEAHFAWVSEKLRVAKILAKELKDERVSFALVRRYENMKNQIAEELEQLSLIESVVNKINGEE